MNIKHSKNTKTNEDKNYHNQCLFRDFHRKYSFRAIFQRYSRYSFISQLKNFINTHKNKD